MDSRDLKSVTADLPLWLVEEMDRIAAVTRESRTSFIVRACLGEVTRLSAVRPFYQPTEPKPRKDPGELTAAELDSFNVFWTKVPRRISIGHAKKAWKKALTRDTTEAIIKGAEHWKEAMNGTESQFIQYPSTWLNAIGWLNEYQPDREVKNIPLVSKQKAKTNSYLDQVKQWKEEADRE